MRREILLNISFGVISLVILLWIILSVFVEPWIGERIETELNKKSSHYTVKIANVNLSLIKRSLELNNVTLFSRDSANDDQFSFKGEIASIKFKGVDIVNILLNKDFNIRELVISKSSIIGKIPFIKESSESIVIPFNVRIDSIYLDKMDFTMKNSLNSQTYSVRDGMLKLYDVHIAKQDTLSFSIINKFDFEAKECITVSSDSMYTYKINDIKYSTSTDILGVNRFSIQPNYKGYDFTSRFKFQTNRYEAEFGDIRALNLDVNNYLKFKSIISSYVEVGKMDMEIFRDKRKAFKHIKKPTIQDMIYNYFGVINIDSIGLLNGNITYTVHAEKANLPGTINFNEIHTKIFKLSNDKLYKTKTGYLELKADAMLMGKSKLSVLLKSKLFDNQNTFTVNGNLAGIEARDLNPMLEKTAFIYATGGKIDAMNFSFKANNTNAAGKLTILYHGLNIAVKNKRTDDTTAFAEKFISIIANSLILDSNPTPGKEVRVGIIDYNRDPERFLFNYCFKSILSGMESSLIISPKKGKKNL